MNRAESYIFGLGELGDLVEQIRYALGTSNDPAALLDYQMMNAWMEYSHGQHPELVLDTLGPIAGGDLALAAPRIAAMPASIASRMLGRLHVANEIAAKLANVYSGLQQALGAYCQAEARVELGQLSRAEEHVAFLAELANSDNLAARILYNVIEARIQLRAGRPREAARTLGTLIAVTGGIDPMGTVAYARAWLGAALAWSSSAENLEANNSSNNSNTSTNTNTNVSSSSSPIHSMTNKSPSSDGGQLPHADGLAISAPPYARYFDCELSLAHALQLAESGLLNDARLSALALVDEANGRGHYLIAMWAAHLALRIQPSEPVSDLVVSQAARVDGDLADSVAQHAIALFGDDGPALEKVAGRFAELGHEGLAHETYLIAYKAYRTRSQKTAANRCSAAAAQLEDGGCVPSFAVRQAPVVVETLTVREREISMAIAEGLSQRAVAEALGMSIRTVESHLHRAYRKLNVTNAQELHDALNQ
jgi:DNA-binding CsgD family transcriptional regulator